MTSHLDIARSRCHINKALILPELTNSANVDIWFRTSVSCHYIVTLNGTLLKHDFEPVFLEVRNSTGRWHMVSSKLRRKLATINILPVNLGMPPHQLCAEYSRSYWPNSTHTKKMAIAGTAVEWLPLATLKGEQ